MKKIFALLAVLAMTLGVNAQNRPGAGKDYNRVEIYYAPMFVDHFNTRSNRFNNWSTSSMTAHGFKAGYTHGFHLSKKWPMFIEAGANLQYNHKTLENEEMDEDGNLYDVSVKYLRLNIPVAFTWRFAVGSKKLWKISPYTGFNFGINLLYKANDRNMFNYVEDFNEAYGSMYPSLTDDYYSAKRFQFGLIEGVNFTYKCWNFGLNYVIDLMPLEKSKTIGINNYTGTFAIGVGYEF